VHAAKAALSRLHSNVAAESLELNANWADVLFVSEAGCVVIVVEGGPITVHVYDGGAGSGPQLLTARTLKVWLPAASAVYEMPLNGHAE
jgi:hypothetical protein